MLTKRSSLLTIAFVNLLTLLVSAQTPTTQDCVGAIPVCQDSITISSNFSGMGNYTNEVANTLGCWAPEDNSVWFKWTIQSGGVLRFAINPTNANQDHDWMLFDMTSASCSQLSSYAGANAAVVRSNTWGAWGFNGPTGVSTPNGGTGTCNGPGGTNGPKWCADLNVSAGETYYLHVTNWTGTVFGFTLDLSASTATLFDTVAPSMDSLASPVNCQIFDSITVRFDEALKCSSIHTGDFQLTGPNGNHAIQSVSTNCGLSTKEVTVHFLPAVSQIGQYTLSIKPGAGYVEDLCNNLDTLDSMTFYYDGSISTELIPTPLQCYEACDGEIDMNIIGGAAPYTYTWNNSLPSDTFQSGLCTGVYTVTLTDANSCEIIDSVEVTQPDDITTSIVSQFMVSCPNTTNCDGGATVSASGGTPPFTYQWSSGEIGPSSSGLCAGINTVTTTDANGCKDTIEVDIDVPDTIFTTAAGDTMICISGNAPIAAASVGGTPSYNFIWRRNALNGPVVSTAQFALVSPVVSTTYYVQTIDDRGCVGDTSKVEVLVRPELGAEFEQIDTICPYDTIDLRVQGTGGDSIYTYSWEDGSFGPSLTVSPNASRFYRVTISDACGTPSHVDSLWVQVGGYSPIAVSIRLEEDSICAGQSVYLIADGRGGHNGPKEYEYQWSHTNDKAGVQFVHPDQTQTYSVTISDLCLSDEGSNAATIYVGKPEKPKIKAVPNETCGPSDVVIYNENFSASSQYTWEFSDGSSYKVTSSDSLVKLFDEYGCNDLTVKVLTAFGCASEQRVSCVVNVLLDPRAHISLSPEHPTNVDPFIWITDASSNSDSRIWYVGNDTILEDQKIHRAFYEGGMDSVVTLVVSSEDGCVDSTTRIIRYRSQTLLYYPTSFTPNGDGLNDAFVIEGEAIQSDGFDLEIFDRWGNQVFRSTNISNSWDGRDLGGNLVPMGTYPFILKYIDHLGEERLIRDHIIISSTGDHRGLR